MAIHKNFFPMENFFIRSVVHTPIRGSFLWSCGYVLRGKHIYRDSVMLHTLSFSPTYFHVFERGFVLFERTNLFFLDRQNVEEFIGAFESQPLLVSSSTEESLLLVVLKGMCLLLNSYFEIVGTLHTPSDVCSVEWNPHAHLVYCATEHNLLILNTKLELLKDVSYRGPISLRSPNLLAIACNGKVHFIERNGLEFGSILELSEPDEGSKFENSSANTISHIHFLDRNTLITISTHLTLYSSKNSKWYKKLQHCIQGKFLGITKNTLHFAHNGIVSIKIFKEFTKSAGMFFVVDGSSLFFYDYWKSIVPPPFYYRAFELSGSIKDVSAHCDRVAVLMCSSHSGRNTYKHNHIETRSCEDNARCCTVSLEVYNIKDFSHVRSIDLSSFQENILEILLLEKVIWMRLETRMFCIDISTNKVRASVVVSGIIKMHVFDQVVLLDDRGRLYVLDKSNEIGKVASLEHVYVESTDDLVYYDVYACKDTYFVQLNSRLFCYGLLIDGVVSFLVHKNLLVLTKHDAIQFTNLEDIRLRREPMKHDVRSIEAYILNNSSSQCERCSFEETPAGIPSTSRITLRSETLVSERNAVILAYTFLLILYVPRGSIEAFSLRPIIVESIKEQIQSEKYREAVSACVVNCISYDIWIDTKINISKIAASVSKSHTIMLFSGLLSILKLGEIDTSRVLLFLAAESVAIKTENVRLNGEHETPALSRCQVEGHEEACIVSLDRHTDPLSILGCLLYALSNTVIVEILVRVGAFSAALAISDSLEDAVKAAVCHTTPDNLIKQSLLLHDMDKSSKIALILDKRDYMHEIQQMRGGDEKFKVFDYLKMHERALDRLFEVHASQNMQCSTEYCGFVQIPECRCTCESSRTAENGSLARALAYVEKHDLYEYSMKYNHPKFIEAYAEKLFRTKNYERSFNLYRKIDLKKALEVSFFLESRVSIEVASQLDILDTAFYRQLVESLAQRGRWEEAARLQRDALQENAMSYFLCSNNMLDSLFEFAKHVMLHRMDEKCQCPEKDMPIDLNQPGTSESVRGILGAYGHMLFRSGCIKEDPYYKEFATKMRELELRESKVLDRKARQVDKCVLQIKGIREEICDASNTTHSYTISGKTMKMSEEEFVHKRLHTLQKEVSGLKTNEVADILQSMDISSNLRLKYISIVKSIQSAVEMAALLL